jgi:hypothetical protein
MLKKKINFIKNQLLLLKSNEKFDDLNLNLELKSKSNLNLNSNSNSNGESNCVDLVNFDCENSLNFSNLNDLIDVEFDLKSSGDVLLNEISNSSLKFKGFNGWSLKIKNVSNSKIIFDNLVFDNSVTIDNCHNCNIWICAHQIRIHDSSDCNLYVYTKCGGILEFCNNISIFNWKMSIEPNFSNLWNQIKDFSLDSSSNKFKFIE